MLTNTKKILLAVADGREICLEPALGNRHGLVTGATGTGKTVTAQSLAESFSALGTPVFLTDVKGDLAGLSRQGASSGGPAERSAQLGLMEKGYRNRGYPVSFWDVFGVLGHSLRATTSDIGPLLFSRLLNLNEAQSSLMRLIFRVADDKGLLLLDLKDLRAMTTHVGENGGDYKSRYGNIYSAGIGVVQRGLLNLEEEGGDRFLGEPALRLEDLLLVDSAGLGRINILAADRLFNSPGLYAAVLLWLLSELFEQFPEVGDQPRPRLVLIFDEAHLLFSGTSKALLEKMAQTMRLIRSKGVGVFFITQNPADVPGVISTQLGHRIGHAMRAYTLKEQKELKAAAQAFRPNPSFKTEEALTSLGLGEALVSFLNSSGVPEPVERALIVPPESRAGVISAAEREEALKGSPLAGRYDTPIDRESAYELLERHFNDDRKRGGRPGAESKTKSAGLDTIFKDVAKQTSRTISNTIGREVGRKIVRGILGGLFSGKK